MVLEPMNSKPNDRVLVLDFGGQFTQLIARRIRELGSYCEILPANAKLKQIKDFAPKAVILSGGPHSVLSKTAPRADKGIVELGVPLMGICYGMQWLAQRLGGRVEAAKNREYGFMQVEQKVSDSPLFRGVGSSSVKTWMSHGDEVKRLPEGFREVARSRDGSLAAMEDKTKNIYAVQFHPEVTHTENGRAYFENFLKIAKVGKSWDLGDFVEQKIMEIREQVGADRHAICALSGGVDSTVAATMVERAIPGRLTCLYIDSGLQREGESEEVMENFRATGLNVIMVDARKEFLKALKGKTDPEVKRKKVGATFIEVFQREGKRLAKKLGKGHTIDWLVQGTLYPDVIESMPPPGRGGFSSTIKSHHNVGGLPRSMKLKLIEPLRELFKDEVRSIGTKLGVPQKILGRHPFPGPGLSIRCLGEVTEPRLKVLRQADKIFVDALRSHGLYEKIWQAGVVLLPISTVGVMGDGRTYENPVAIRAVTSDDGMTANWYPFSSEFLAEVSSRIINEVKGVNRVVYDISSKPPATIEWE